MNETNKRWIVRINYRSEHGDTIVEHFIMELSELDALVERGPHWDTIINIEIELNALSSGEKLTVEQATKL